ncbi:RloB family protein [Candidatus Poriferisodalis sp.]|uniref:RloB family protein n=1 Tax=Candidatus Poriferisodalis sp. TaxID=3101277 RepID=UPI003B516048
MRNRIRRTAQKRKLKKTILIVCEGQETERNYLDGLKREETISKAFAITVVPGRGGSRSQIIERAINQKAQRREMDVVLCVLDTESLETIEAKEDLATSRQEAAHNDITLYLSNPAFEVWLLAHFRRTSRSFRNCNAVIVELDKEWSAAFRQPYDKSDDKVYQRLATRTQAAVTNAKMVVEIDHKEKPDIADRNSSTDFYQLVERLLSGTL